MQHGLLSFRPMEVILTHKRKSKETQSKAACAVSNFS